METELLEEIVATDLTVYLIDANQQGASPPPLTQSAVVCRLTGTCVINHEGFHLDFHLLLCS